MVDYLAAATPAFGLPWREALFDLPFISKCHDASAHSRFGLLA
jgi:hypothetical protein